MRKRCIRVRVSVGKGRETYWECLWICRSLGMTSSWVCLSGECGLTVTVSYPYPMPLDDIHRGFDAKSFSIPWCWWCTAVGGALLGRRKYAIAYVCSHLSNCRHCKHNINNIFYVLYRYQMFRLHATRLTYLIDMHSKIALTSTLAGRHVDRLMRQFYPPNPCTGLKQTAWELMRRASSNLSQ